MAKLPMQRVYLCALKRDRQDILESLQRLEMLEIREFSKEDSSSFEKVDLDIQDRELIKKNIDNARDSLEILKTLSAEKIAEPFFLEGRKSLSQKDYESYMDKGYDETVKVAKTIVDSYKRIREKKSEISQLTAKLESLEPWEKLTVPVNFKGTESTRFFIGTLPESLSKLQIEQLITDKLTDNSENSRQIPFEVEVVSTIDVLTYFTLMCLKKDEDFVYEALRASGFTPPIIEGDTLVIGMKNEALEKIRLYKEEISSLEKDILSNVSKIEDLRFLLDYESLRYDNTDVVSKLHQTSKTFMLKGYVPKKYSQELVDVISSKYLAEIQFEEVEEYDEDAPILLENNAYSGPLEGVIESYGLPSAGDLDPTLAVSIFYYFMFGLMLSDAGYGLVIFAVSLIGLTVFKNTMEDSWKKTLRMYLYCGAFTIFWGIMFGSYFGDIVDVATETFTGNRVTIAPVWYFPVKDPMRLLTFSLIVGIIHLFTGMFLKGVQYFKKNDYKSLLSDVIVWYGLLIGCIIVLLSTDMLRNIFKYEFIIPAGILTIGKILALASAIGIIVTNGSSPNIGVRLAQGLYALYGISSYLSDVLSYSRLLALGLATGVIASVINMMGGMVSGSIGGPVGVLVFAIIMIFGHAFNLAINALGAYVHSNRLQYVELFGKFYEGGGFKFSPLKMNTKYFKFKESRNNE